MSTTEEGRKKQLEHDLVNLYLQEGLLLIGGVQDKNRTNNMQMLYYKVEITNPGVKKAIQYTPEVTIKEEEQLDKEQCEKLLNEVQLSSNSVLKAVMTFEDSKKWHIIVTQPNQNDRLYMVTAWPTAVFSQEEDETEQVPHIPGLNAKERFIEKAALWIVQEELAMTNHLCEFIMNSNIEESCLVYSN
jgi:hypothetical protein